MTPQMVLVFGWTAMKEVGLIFGHLVGTAFRAAPPGRPLSSPARQASANRVQGEALKATGSLLLELLLAARHKGAVEMIATGFTSHCEALWQSPDSAVVSGLSVSYQPGSGAHGMAPQAATPATWLERLLTAAAVADDGSITRRSAGYPAAVLAILAAAPAPNHGEAHPAVHRAAERILSLARGGESAGVPAKVHGMNILRAVVRDSAVGPHVAGLLGAAAEVAVAGFAAAEYAVRNASLMLFSAVVNRLVGVKHVRDEHASFNRVPAGELFARHPVLRATLIGVVAVRPSRVQPEVYPALALLGRMRNADGALLAAVDTQLASADMFVRRAAARAAAALCPPQRRSEVLQAVQLAPSGRFNADHGRLLKAHALLREAMADGPAAAAMAASALWPAVGAAAVHYGGALRCHTAAAAFFELCSSLVKCGVDSCSEEARVALQSAAAETGPDADASSEPSAAQRRAACATVWCGLAAPGTLGERWAAWLADGAYEVRAAAAAGAGASAGMIEHRAIVARLRSGGERHPAVLAALLASLQAAGDLEGVRDDVMALAADPSCAVAAAALRLLPRLSMGIGVVRAAWAAAAPDRPTAVRLAAAAVLEHVAAAGGAHTADGDALPWLWATIRLLEDEEAAVRRAAARAAMVAVNDGQQRCPDAALALLLQQVAAGEDAVDRLLRTMRWALEEMQLATGDVAGQYLLFEADTVADGFAEPVELVRRCAGLVVASARPESVGAAVHSLAGSVAAVAERQLAAVLAQAGRPGESLPLARRAELFATGGQDMALAATIALLAAAAAAGGLPGSPDRIAGLFGHACGMLMEETSNLVGLLVEGGWRGEESTAFFK